MNRVSSKLAVVMVAALAAWWSVGTAHGQLGRFPVSDVDPRTIYVDQLGVLGNNVEPGVQLVDDQGREFRWEEMLGKPFILVLSYYTCDGSCSVVNVALADLLKSVTVMKPGEGFRILTLSFDSKDTPQTTSKFKKDLDLPANVASAWTIATFKSEEDLKKVTERVGFKFFWSRQDKAFLHPGVFLFFSPEGKLARVLYQQDAGARDVELALLDANLKHIRPTEVSSLVMSLCYSYNYAEGKYQLSIPIFVGVGALLIGFLLLSGALVIYKFGRKGRVMKGANHEQMA